MSKIIDKTERKDGYEEDNIYSFGLYSSVD